jgi:hypothetical protein
MPLLPDQLVFGSHSEPLKLIPPPILSLPCSCDRDAVVPPCSGSLSHQCLGKARCSRCFLCLAIGLESWSLGEWGGESPVIRVAVEHRLRLTEDPPDHRECHRVCAVLLSPNDFHQRAREREEGGIVMTASPGSSSLVRIRRSPPAELSQVVLGRLAFWSVRLREGELGWLGSRPTRQAVG